MLLVGSCTVTSKAEGFLERCCSCLLRSTLTVVPEDPRFPKASFDLISLSEAPGDASFSCALTVKELGEISGDDEKPRRVIQVMDVDSGDNGPRF